MKNLEYAKNSDANVKVRDYSGENSAVAPVTSNPGGANAGSEPSFGQIEGTTGFSLNLEPNCGLEVLTSGKYSSSSIKPSTTRKPKVPTIYFK